MTRTILMALLTLASPLTAFAGSSVDFTYVGGTLSGTNAGLSLSGSTLIAVNALNGTGSVFGNLGTVSLSTGRLLSGSLSDGGTFSGAGSSFVITGDANGVSNAVIFQGSFTGPVAWTLGKGNIYTLTCDKSCSLTGTWMNGIKVTGLMVSITLPSGNGEKGEFSGSVSFGSGDTTISTVPEPGTLGLLGTGLVGLAGALHRKFKS